MNDITNAGYGFSTVEPFILRGTSPESSTAVSSLIGSISVRLLCTQRDRAVSISGVRLLALLMGFLILTDSQ